MVKALISDFSRVLLFPKDGNYKESLNELHRNLSKEFGYKLLDHFKLNVELLEFYKSLKRNLNLYLFTSETIQDSPELQEVLIPVFEEVYSALKMGTSKKSAESYTRIVSTLNI